MVTFLICGRTGELVYYHHTVIYCSTSRLRSSHLHLSFPSRLHMYSRYPATPSNVFLYST